MRSRLSYWSKSPRAFPLCQQPAQATHHSEERLSKERVRTIPTALAILGRADSLIPDDFMMEKYQKLIKRQRPEKTEESANSGLLASTPAPADRPMKSSKASVEEQAIDETVEVPSSPERWEPLYVYTPNSLTYSQWQQELREIEWEIENDIWESCPYD